MPYITKKDRAKLATIDEVTPTTAGELNYCFTMLGRAYVQHKGLSYQTINDIVGALEGAKLEFVRRVVNDYEDTKIAANGDVYLEEFKNLRGGVDHWKKGKR